MADTRETLLCLLAALCFHFPSNVFQYLLFPFSVFHFLRVFTQCFLSWFWETLCLLATLCFHSICLYFLCLHGTQSVSTMCYLSCFEGVVVWPILRIQSVSTSAILLNMFKSLVFPLLMCFQSVCFHSVFSLMFKFAAAFS